MIRPQRSGYDSGNLSADLTIGTVYGLSLSLWSYVYAAIVFVGPLSIYLPVGIMVMLLGWVLVSIWTVLMSREPLHTATTDDQAVVIIGAIAGLMTAFLGAEAASPRGLATILAIMALTTLGFSAACYAVGRFRLSRVLEMLPFPVVCGFMASVGWLLMDAGFEVAADVGLSVSSIGGLAEGNRPWRLGLSVGLSLGLIWLTARFSKPWILPAASLAIVLAYYGVVWGAGLSHSEQLADGWLFDVPLADGGGWSLVAALSPADIQWPFVVRALPLMLTVILISMLYASMTVTGLKAISSVKLNIGHEFRLLSAGNLLSAAVCCPPGYTDVVATSMYRKYGASSRWFVLTSSSVGLAVAIFAGGVIAYVPKLLMTANIFLFAFTMLYDWLYRNVRGFGAMDYGVVLIIVITTVTVGFAQGVAAGIALTVLLFVFRYSRVSAIQSRHTLADQRSSVERSVDANTLFARSGDRVVIYHLRGYLFFGTANAILDEISEREKLGEGAVDAVLMDLKRVNGLDVSALKAFAHIKALCEDAGAVILYSAVPPHTRTSLCAVDAVSHAGDEPLIFDNDDLALEFLEERLLAQGGLHTGQLRIRDFLQSMLEDPDKVDLLLRALQPVELAEGSTLFEEGDPDTGLFIVEQGSLSAYIRVAGDRRLRVKKFSPGSLVGELSAYLRGMLRTATVVADRPSVVYHLDPRELERIDSDRRELKACVHELVATTLAERVRFMNRRLIVESGD